MADEKYYIIGVHYDKYRYVQITTNAISYKKAISQIKKHFKKVGRKFEKADLKMTQSFYTQEEDLFV